MDPKRNKQEEKEAAEAEKENGLWGGIEVGVFGS